MAQAIEPDYKSKNIIDKICEPLKLMHQCLIGSMDFRYKANFIQALIACCELTYNVLNASDPKNYCEINQTYQTVADISARHDIRQYIHDRSSLDKISENSKKAKIYADLLGLQLLTTKELNLIKPALDKVAEHLAKSNFASWSEKYHTALQNGMHYLLNEYSSSPEALFEIAKWAPLVKEHDKQTVFGDFYSALEQSLSKNGKEIYQLWSQEWGKIKDRKTSFFHPKENKLMLMTLRLLKEAGIKIEPHHSALLEEKGKPLSKKLEAKPLKIIKIN